MSSSGSDPSPTASPPASTTPVGKRDPHPQRDLIRQNIDKWFSEENLKRDFRFLNAINKKGLNSPVNVYQCGARLKHICDPKPSDWQIVEACRNSTMVDVVDKNHIRRKIPFVMEDDDDEPGDGVWGAEDIRPKLKPIPAHPGIAAKTFKICWDRQHAKEATGFEPGFIDAPMTPQQHEENLEIYSTEIDAPSRIGHAIERFAARKKFTLPYQKAFFTFLKYGGVHPANRIGQGNSKKEIMEDEELTKEEKLELCAQFDVDVDDKLDEKKWAIDFEGVAKGYLSTDFADELDMNFHEGRIDHQCDVMHSFYSYLRYHTVCPEYKADIEAAIQVVNKARVELKTIHDLTAQFPTPFSKACSVIFGGEWKQFFGHKAAWGDFREDENPEMSKSDARVIVGAALMSLAPNNIFDAAFPPDTQAVGEDEPFPNIKFTDKRFATLEVIAIERATPETVECYKEAGVAEKEIDAPPVGKLICKFWDMPTADEWDIPPNLQPKTLHDDTYELWLEDDILADCSIGMKLSATLRKLFVSTTPTSTTDTAPAEDGIWILDSISRIYCSFVTFLVNDMVTHKFREPEWHSEDALMGCKHEVAERQRDLLQILKKDKERKDEEGIDSESEHEDEDEVVNGKDSDDGKKSEALE